MAAAKGASTPQAWQIAKHDFWGLLTAGWKLWPWVSLANYSIIKSVEGRALVGNLAGFVWGIYLSLTSASK
jgi:protein Mpv17